jgi:hypothetical protein
MPVLTPHPSTRCEPVRSLSGHVARTPQGLLSLEFLLEGDLDRLRIPGRGPGGRRDELWKHTCFEAFIVLDHAAGYFEINLSPSFDWAVYQFSGYRAGMASSEALGKPRIAMHAEGGRLRLEARFAPDTPDRPVARGAGALGELNGASGALAGLDGARVALAAVIEAEDGRLSYWALRHPAGKPDFHHPDGFVLGIHT